MIGELGLRDSSAVGALGLHPREPWSESQSWRTPVVRKSSSRSFLLKIKRKPYSEVEKSLENTPPWLGIEPGPWGGQTVSYPTELLWLVSRLV